MRYLLIALVCLAVVGCSDSDVAEAQQGFTWEASTALDGVNWSFNVDYYNGTGERIPKTLTYWVGDEPAAIPFWVEEGYNTLTVTSGTNDTDEAQLIEGKIVVDGEAQELSVYVVPIQFYNN